jgi:hypothetical protein
MSQTIGVSHISPSWTTVFTELALTVGTSPEQPSESAVCTVSRLKKEVVTFSRLPADPRRASLEDR